LETNTHRKYIRKAFKQKYLLELLQKEYWYCKQISGLNIKYNMSIRNPIYNSIDFLRLPLPLGERRKSIDSPWGWGKAIDFQASLFSLLNIYDTH
jgi:hypothetical protein